MPIYVKNKDLREELIKSKEQNELTATALKMVTRIAEHFSDNYIYMYDEDKQDCIRFAIMDCYLYWRNYDPDKSANAFGYITQVVKNGTIKGWRKIRTIPKSKQVSISNNNIYSI